MVKVERIIIEGTDLQMLRDILIYAKRWLNQDKLIPHEASKIWIKKIEKLLEV